MLENRQIIYLLFRSTVSLYFGYDFGIYSKELRPMVR
jgi:hypothetical protein